MTVLFTETLNVFGYLSFNADISIKMLFFSGTSFFNNQSLLTLFRTAR